MLNRRLANPAQREMELGNDVANCFGMTFGDALSTTIDATNLVSEEENKGLLERQLVGPPIQDTPQSQ